MSEMKTLNGYEIVDAKAREDIATLQESFENIEIPEAGGDGVKTIIVTTGSTYTDEEQSIYEQLFHAYNYNKGTELKELLSKYRFVIFKLTESMVVSKISFSSSYSGSYLTLSGKYNYTEGYVSISFDTDRKVKGKLCSLETYQPEDTSSSDSNWYNNGTSTYLMDPYNSYELYIAVRDLDTNAICTSYYVSTSAIGFRTYEEYPFVTPKTWSSDRRTPYWYYTGDTIEICNFDYGYDIQLIAYKTSEVQE